MGNLDHTISVVKSGNCKLKQMTKMKCWIQYLFL